MRPAPGEPHGPSTRATGPSGGLRKFEVTSSYLKIRKLTAEPPGDAENEKCNFCGTNFRDQTKMRFFLEGVASPEGPGCAQFGKFAEENTECLWMPESVTTLGPIFQHCAFPKWYLKSSSRGGTL